MPCRPANSEPAASGFAPPGGFRVLPGTLADGLHDPAHGAVSFGQQRGGSSVLPQRPQAGGRVADAMSNGFLPRAELLFRRDFGRRQFVFQPAEFLDGKEIRGRVETVGLPDRSPRQTV